MKSKSLYLTKNDPGEKGVACGIIGDAGSSGTRIYIVHGPEPEVEEVGHSNGGLAKIGVDQAMRTLGPFLEIAHGRYQLLCDPTATAVPPLSILGTAGTRLLSEPDRKQLWEDLLSRVTAHPLSFNIKGMRTITGIEEGLFGSLSANVLLKKLDAALVPRGALSGVLDLGGASTQIALPKFTAARRSVSVEDFFINSYLGYGLHEIKPTMDNMGLGDKCKFGPESTGCREFIRKCFKELKTSCRAAPACAGADFETTHKLSAQTDDFVLVSAYVYVMKFGTWIEPEIDLSKKASLADIQEWADKACAIPYEDLLAKYNAADPKDVQHSNLETLPLRCFHMQYIPVLLEDALGIEKDREVFRFSNEVDGSSIDWPLGAFLYQMQHPDSVSSPIIAIKGRWTSWVWVFWFLVCATLCFLWSKRPGRTVEYSADKPEPSSVGKSGGSGMLNSVI